MRTTSTVTQLTYDEFLARTAGIIQRNFRGYVARSYAIDREMHRLCGDEGLEFFRIDEGEALMFFTSNGKIRTPREYRGFSRAALRQYLQMDPTNYPHKFVEEDMQFYCFYILKSQKQMRRMEARDRLAYTLNSGSSDDSEGKSDNGEDDDSSSDDDMSEQYDMATDRLFRELDASQHWQQRRNQIKQAAIRCQSAYRRFQGRKRHTELLRTVKLVDKRVKTRLIPLKERVGYLEAMVEHLLTHAGRQEASIDNLQSEV